MLISSSINTNVLYGVTLVAKTEETELLIELRVDMVVFEMLEEGSSKGVVIMVAWNSVVAYSWSFLLNLVQFITNSLKLFRKARIVNIT